MQGRFCCTSMFSGVGQEEENEDGVDDASKLYKKGIGFWECRRHASSCDSGRSKINPQMRSISKKKTFQTASKP